jgi:hypothetical protein
MLSIVIANHFLVGQHSDSDPVWVARFDYASSSYERRGFAPSNVSIPFRLAKAISRICAGLAKRNQQAPSVSETIDLEVKKAK